MTKFANEHRLPHGWQERFYDHIIRDMDEYERIFNYITDNPRNWDEDKLHSSHLQA